MLVLLDRNKQRVAPLVAITNAELKQKRNEDDELGFSLFNGDNN